MAKDASCRSAKQDIFIDSPTEIIYYSMGERFRYEIRERSREVTLASDIEEPFSFQL